MKSRCILQFSDFARYCGVTGVIIMVYLQGILEAEENNTVVVWGIKMAQHSKSISEDCFFGIFSTLQNGCFDLPESYTIYKEAPWLNTYLLCIGAARYFIVSTFPFLRIPKKIYCQIPSPSVQTRFCNC